MLIIYIYFLVNIIVIYLLYRLTRFYAGIERMHMDFTRSNVTGKGKDIAFTIRRLSQLGFRFSLFEGILIGSAVATHRFWMESYVSVIILASVSSLIHLFIGISVWRYYRRKEPDLASSLLGEGSVDIEV